MIADSWGGFVAWVWPPRCWVCGAPADVGGTCAAHAVQAGLSGARCGVCAGELPDGILDGVRCARCRREGRAFLSTVAAFDYGDPAVREWVLRYKHGGRVDLVVPLAGLLRTALEGHGFVLSDHDRLVPVPLHVSRLVERGYDQAALLAAEVARGTGARVQAVLTRVRATPPQGAQLGPTRANNVRGAFQVCLLYTSPSPRD